MSFRQDVDRNVDKVRVLIGDTSDDSTLELISDGEIEHFLVQNSDRIHSAAADCADAIAAKLTRRTDVRMGRMAIDANSLMGKYTSLANKLRSQGRVEGVLVPSISVGDKTAFENNLAYTKSKIKKGMHDNNG